MITSISIDILNHRLVPKHEVVSKEEKKRTLERFAVSKEQLPKILASDAVVKKISAKSGDLIKITRDSPTAGQYTYYRMVTE